MGHPRHEQKPTVTDHLPQIRLAGFFAPPNPSIPGGHSPSRGTEGQPSNPSVDRTVNQITHLRSTQGAGSQIMIRLHQLIPETGQRAVLALNKNQFDLSQRLQPTAKRLNLWKRQRRPFFLNHSPVANPRLRKREMPPTVQLQQGHPTAHLLRLAIGALPVEPLADAQRQCPTRYRRSPSLMVARIRSQISSLNSWPHIRTTYL